MAKMTAYNNVAGLNAALRSLPKHVTAELRDASVAIAQSVADKAASRAMRVGGVAKLVAPSIKATRDRIPIVKMGGSTKLPPHSSGRARRGNRQTIGDVMWGAEFGGGARSSTRQFMPHLGRTGYFLWPTVRQESDEIVDAYSDALLDALEKI